ncbi:MAG: PQQ-binding-like beta-propeller repeat protein, partial [Variovorax sp.]
MNLKRRFAAVVAVSLLAACQGTSKPKPAELPPNVVVLGVRQAWSIKIPQVTFALQANVTGDTVTVAGADGTVVAIDARNGTESWRANVGAPLSAGVGSDGSLTAVVTRKNELVTLQGGKVIWRQQLTSETYTAPLVAG